MNREYMKGKGKITLLLIVYNEGEIVRRALESAKNVVDEIMVIHDGKCTDNTLKICKEYTKNIIIGSHTGRASLHMIDAFNKIKTEWILKLDADEYLSEKMREGLGKLVKVKRVSAYSFLWRWWDGKKYITKNFPHKMALFKKSKISFLEFPGNDEPEIKGITLKIDDPLEHRPNYNNFTWKSALTRGTRRAKDQAKWTLKEFKDLRKYQYGRKDFKLAVKLRKNFTLLAMFILPIAAFIKIVSAGFKEGFPVFSFAIKDAYYQATVCYFILKLKHGKEI